MHYLINSHNAIDFVNISKSYANGQFILENLNLSIPSGQITSIMGPSGSGKSTALRMIAGFEKPTSGNIFIHGHDSTNTDPCDRSIGMVFQNFSLFPHLDVYSNISFGIHKRKNQNEISKIVDNCLQIVGLNELKHALPNQLSGGQQQRISIARAIATDSSILLFDEPLSNVDKNQRKNISKDIRKIQKDLALTVVYVTHDYIEAISISDRLVLLNEGKILQEGSPLDLYKNPKDEFVAAFFGDAEILSGKSNGDDFIVIENKIHIKKHSPKISNMKIAVHPNAWKIIPASGNGLAGRIVSCAYQGRCMEYRVLTDIGSFIVTEKNGGYKRQINSPVNLTVYPELIQLIAMH